MLWDVPIIQHSAIQALDFSKHKLYEVFHDIEISEHYLVFSANKLSFIFILFSTAKKDIS